MDRPALKKLPSPWIALVLTLRPSLCRSILEFRSRSGLSVQLSEYASSRQVSVRQIEGDSAVNRRECSLAGRLGSAHRSRLDVEDGPSLLRKAEFRQTKGIA